MNFKQRLSQMRVQAHGSLFIHPPPVMGAAIMRWRERQGLPRHDCPPTHITLTRSFIRQPDEHAWRQLRAIAAETPPFILRLAGLEAFWPGTNMAWQPVEPRERLGDLHQRLQASGLFHPPPAGRIYTPHASLYRLHVADARALQRELRHLRSRLPARQFLCKHIDYVCDGALQRTRIRRSLQLGGSDFSPTALSNPDARMSD